MCVNDITWIQWIRCGGEERYQKEKKKKEDLRETSNVAPACRGPKCLRGPMWQGVGYICLNVLK